MLEASQPWGLGTLFKITKYLLASPSVQSVKVLAEFLERKNDQAFGVITFLSTTLRKEAGGGGGGEEAAQMQRHNEEEDKPFIWSSKVYAELWIEISNIANVEVHAFNPSTQKQEKGGL